MLRLFIGEPCLTPHLLRKPHTESLGLEDFGAGRFHSPSRLWNSGCRLTGKNSPLGSKTQKGVNCVLLSHGRGHSGLPEVLHKGRLWKRRASEIL